MKRIRDYRILSLKWDICFTLLHPVLRDHGAREDRKILRATGKSAFSK